MQIPWYCINLRVLFKQCFCLKQIPVRYLCLLLRPLNLMCYQASLDAHIYLRDVKVFFLIHNFIKFFLPYTNFSSILTIFVISPEYIFNLKFSVIPIFGVLTHKDKINENDEDFRTLEKDFREGLGLPDNRFLLCTTYCDDYDKHHGKSRLDQRHPELDIPILKFMRQVSVNFNHDRKLGKLAQYKIFK